MTIIGDILQISVWILFISTLNSTAFLCHIHQFKYMIAMLLDFFMLSSDKYAENLSTFKYLI